MSMCTLRVFRLNGMLFKDHKAFITHFKSYQERQAAEKMTAKMVNSKEVHVGQAQKKKKRHFQPSHKFKQCVNLCAKSGCFCA